ncbi:MetQ/NlpA family ABC transporter substrate-binding protein [Ornithinicoccus hortensis]|uniref:Lipoprotein n=1 Tax=Ornithinicoccus hortensis TaxID=82346 RepID=A0A542YQU7_9MICO|nr:MetQ/NlpA family ABC transporter substrate-binding protein [Ornithinicoccus hortensis]TQL50472.1 D-methionine transport system substrate-binding protein [Ornithinicoccus hortensis]
MRLTPTGTTALALAAALTLSACGGTADAEDGTASGSDGPLRVAATPVPHAEILQFVADELAPDAGLDLEVVEFTDYVQPNVALDDGSVDANYYQHSVYLADQEATAGYDFTELLGVNFQPQGLYSSSITDLGQLPEGSTVAIPNDPVNGARGLLLLQQEGLLTLADDAGDVPTSLDITDNPLDLEFSEVEAAQLPRSLEDVELAAIPGNYAIEADLNPAEDALSVESAEGSPYVIQLVTRTGNEDDERLQLLQELLSSDETRQFIEETYQGAVVPAF